MNNKFLAIIVVLSVSVLVGGLAGFLLGNGGSNVAGVGELLGAATTTVPAVSTTTHGTANQSRLLYQWEHNVATELSNQRTFNGTLVATSSWNPAVITTSTVATTTIAVSGSALGDIVDIYFSLSTASTTVGFLMPLKAEVSAAGTVYVQLGPLPPVGPNNTQISGGAFDIATGTLTTRVRPGLINLPAFRISTSSAPYNN